jgi:hypothetical protein
MGLRTLIILMIFVGVLAGQNAVLAHTDEHTTSRTSLIDAHCALCDGAALLAHANTAGAFIQILRPTTAVTTHRPNLNSPALRQWLTLESRGPPDIFAI